MLKYFNSSNLTSTPDLVPPSGYKWIILSGFLILTTSATAGTRYVNAGANLLDSGVIYALLNIPGSTGVSTVYRSILTPYGTLPGLIGNLTLVTATPYVVLSEFDHITFAQSLIAGDTFEYYFLVDEVPA